jgi:hypothetical protein
MRQAPSNNLGDAWRQGSSQIPLGRVGTEVRTGKYAGEATGPAGAGFSFLTRLGAGCLGAEERSRSNCAKEDNNSCYVSNCL